MTLRQIIVLVSDMIGDLKPFLIKIQNSFSFVFFSLECFHVLHLTVNEELFLSQKLLPAIWLNVFSSCQVWGILAASIYPEEGPTHTLAKYKVVSEFPSRLLSVIHHLLQHRQKYGTGRNP